MTATMPIIWRARPSIACDQVLRPRIPKSRVFPKRRATRRPIPCGQRSPGARPRWSNHCRRRLWSPRLATKRAPPRSAGRREHPASLLGLKTPPARRRRPIYLRVRWSFMPRLPLRRLKTTAKTTAMSPMTCWRRRNRCFTRCCRNSLTALVAISSKWIVVLVGPAAYSGETDPRRFVFWTDRQRASK